MPDPIEGDRFPRIEITARPPAAEQYATFPASVRRNILRWIASARTPPRRTKRIAATASEACAGRRVKSHG